MRNAPVHPRVSTTVESEMGQLCTSRISSLRGPRSSSKPGGRIEKKVSDGAPILSPSRVEPARPRFQKIAELD